MNTNSGIATSTSLVIVPLPGDRDQSPAADLGRVLTGCLAPVLFVPDYD